MNHIADLNVLSGIVDAQVFGARHDWEKHETGEGHIAFIKPIEARDVELKARIATRYDELGFVPKFFSESGREFVALESVKRACRYHCVEEAFVKQILTKLES
jgi:hypothetical protein